MPFLKRGENSPSDLIKRTHGQWLRSAIPVKFVKKIRIDISSAKGGGGDFILPPDWSNR
jgi:hypothetical protein